MNETNNLKKWILPVLFAILHIIIGIMCIIFFAMFLSPTAIGTLANNGYIIFMIFIIFLGATYFFTSAAAIIIRELKRQKMSIEINKIQNTLEEYKGKNALLDIKFKSLTDIKCPKCGKTYPQGTKFCQDCGKNLTENSIKKDG